MRNLLFLAIMLFVLNSHVYSDTYNMDVNLTGGEVVTIPVDDIQRIEFGDCGAVEDPEGPQHTADLFELMQNRPNPFNHATTIAYQIARSADIKISVFDIGGRLVKEILNETQNEGPHQVTWDGTDRNNAHAASGIYFYTVESGNLTLSKKMILLN
jgi:hypothetical protein